MGNVSAQDDQALIDAASEGRLDTVKYLVSQGADVRAQEGYTLIYAASKGHFLDVVSFLLDMYEDPGHLHSYPKIEDVIDRNSRDRSIISSSLGAGTSTANLISTYY